jgi:choline dehydrogenase-like flavoprotein
MAAHGKCPVLDRNHSDEGGYRMRDPYKKYPSYNSDDCGRDDGYKNDDYKNDDYNSDDCCDSYPKKHRIKKVYPCHEADYVVIGMGAGGAAVARRLACKYSVIGLEAGTKDDDDPLIYNPNNSTVLSGTYINKFFTPNGHTQTTDGQRFWPYVGGREFGGGTSVNGMQFVESTPNYWNEIAATADDAAWGYANVKRVYTDYQNFHGVGNPSVHGFKGPVDIRTGVSNREAAEAFVVANNEVTGDSEILDYNDPKTPNGSYVDWQLFQTPGKARVSTSTAYLDNVRKFCECQDRGDESPVLCREVYLNKNHKLRIYSKSTVSRILFENSYYENRGKRHDGEEYGCRKPRANAVSALVNGQEIIFKARKGVILCAGFNSPLILQRSGIADKRDLKKWGIKCVHHNPQVGQNLWNHTLYLLTGIPDTKPVPGTVTDSEAIYSGGSFTTDPTTPEDVRAFQYIGLASAPFAYTIILQPLIPKSSGFIKLYDSDPNKPPFMQFNYMKTQSEIDSNFAAVKIMRDILLKMGLKPTDDVSTDEKLLEFVNNNLRQSFHWVGACSMNRDARLGVVDGDLKVYGVNGLYVADDSILPRVTDGNTAAPAILIGNILADKILKCPITLPKHCRHYKKERKCVDKCCRQPKAKCKEYCPSPEDRPIAEGNGQGCSYGKPKYPGCKGGSGQCKRD